MVADGSLEAGEFLLRRVEADGQALDLAVPSVVLGLVDPWREVTDDLDEAVPLAWVDAQHLAADAGFSELDNLRLVVSDR
jgi:hypothetical protein